MHKTIKAQLSKVYFFLNRNPIVEKTSTIHEYIPENYNAVITITADFELAWGPRYSKPLNNTLDKTLNLARRERINIPKILQLCEEYNVPITWATVGHLFLRECKRITGKVHQEIPKVKNYNGPYWNFKGNDWFEYDPCSNYLDSPEWYAPDLIEMILSSKVKHEIGCHTFSHIDCRDEVCPPELFEAEINECKKAAEKLGLLLKSFVHPGHTIGNLDKLSELGFTSFQSDPGNVLGYPVKHKNGLWELKRTYEFFWREGWSVKYHIYRYKTIIDRAIRSNTVCNFWFHPSFDGQFVEKVFPEILAYIQKKRNKIFISTIQEYTDWLNRDLNV